jgi:hypothetical protein
MDGATDPNKKRNDRASIDPVVTCGTIYWCNLMPAFIARGTKFMKISLISTPAANAEDSNRSALTYFRIIPEAEGLSLDSSLGSLSNEFRSPQEIGISKKPPFFVRVS